MQTRSILLSLALTSLSVASPSEVPASETKAASPLINCGCQCAPLTFRDAKVRSLIHNEDLSVILAYTNWLGLR